MGNVRSLDKQYIACGLVRIGFIRPKVDIVVLCNPGELKVLVHTVEIVRNLEEPTFTERKYSSKERSSCERNGGQNPELNDNDVSELFNSLVG